VKQAARPERRSGTRSFAVTDALLLDALGRLAGACSTAEVADAVVPCLVEQDGVRAVAVVERDRRHVVVTASAGYDCGTMAAGAQLPLDAGLPVTEAVRTGRTVALGAALRRAARQDRAAADLAVVTAMLGGPRSTDGVSDVAVRQLPTASAGHPAPLVLDRGTATVVAVEPGPPLALEGGRPQARPEAEATLAARAAVLLHTDGLVERRTGRTVALVDPRQLAHGLPHDLEAAADALLAAADAAGAAHDDVSVLLARP
jgi:hypothetical protein